MLNYVAANKEWIFSGSDGASIFFKAELI